MHRSTIICLSLVLPIGLLVGTVQALQDAEMTTNKGFHNLRQPVEVTITNTGSDPLTYAVGYEKYTKDPTDWHGLTPSPLNGRQVPGGTYVGRVPPDLDVTFIIVVH